MGVYKIITYGPGAELGFAFLLLSRVCRQRQLGPPSPPPFHRRRLVLHPLAQRPWHRRQAFRDHGLDLFFRLLVLAVGTRSLRLNLAAIADARAIVAGERAAAEGAVHRAISSTFASRRSRPIDTSKSSPSGQSLRTLHPASSRPAISQSSVFTE